MKISPLNQTLILASERRVQGDKPSGDTLGQALDAASSGGVLKRLTIVAARPDAELVYVRADYANPQPADDGSESSSQSPPGTSLVASVAGPQSSNRGTRDSYGNFQTGGRDGGLSSYLRPVDQYARTQRNWSGAPSVGLDVLA